MEGQEDIYIHEEDALYAFHQDRVQVLVKPEQKGSRKEGKIVQILGHGISEIVGTFEKSQNFGFVIPDNHKVGKDFFIPRDICWG